MKKYLLLIASAIVGALFVSCEKTPAEEDPEPTTVVRIKTYSLVGDGWADVYQYSYNEDGTVSKVYREEEKQWTFEYSGNKVIVKDFEGATAYEITLGANNYAQSMVAEGSEYAYTYDSDGHMTKITKDGTVVSNITIEDGCITKWSKWRDGVEVFKIHTYISTANCGIHNIYSEEGGVSQWMMETGLFGKGTDYLCGTSQWDYSEAGATYTYDLDENGAVLNEHKDYPDWPEEFVYEWEEVTIETN